jgi:hypothetical protein
MVPIPRTNDITEKLATFCRKAVFAVPTLPPKKFKKNQNTQSIEFEFFKM